MKQRFKKILGVLFALILVSSKFAYADVVPIGVESIIYKPWEFLIGFICIIILVISAISYLNLKATIKMQKLPGTDESLFISEEKIKRKKDTIQWMIYVSCSILAIIELIFLYNGYKISGIMFSIPMILFGISIIARIYKNKKVSNIICIVSVVITLIYEIII